MKKVLSLFTAIIIALSGLCTFAVETNDTKLNFNLTCKGQNTIAVKKGEIITVTYTLENTKDEKFTVTSNSNDIGFDPNFFEYLGPDKENPSDCVNHIGLHETSWGAYSVYFNGSHVNGKEYEAKQYMGAFKLKVIADSGKSTVSNQSVTAYDNDGKKYQSDFSNLNVFIGTVPNTLYNVTFTDGNNIKSTQEEAGEIDVIAALKTNPGYEFKGWRNDDDEVIYQPGDKFNVTKDTNFTAVWEKLNEEKYYILTFDTNGGSEVRSIKEKENTVIDLTKYITKKDGYNFTSWFSDSALTNAIPSVTLDSNKTVYAGWSEESSDDNNGGGGGSGGGYRPSKPTPQPDSSAKDNIQNNAPDIFIDKHIAYIIGREDGYVFPNENITRAETAEIIYRLLKDEVKNNAKTDTNVFKDVNDNDWFNTSVSVLANLGFVNGREVDAFEPDESITRAEFTTITARLSKASYTGDDLFPDIALHWAKDYINIAASIGWVNGDNGIFRPDDNITRAEVITLMNRVLNRIPQSKADLLNGMLTPPDNTDETQWYYLAVQEAVNGHNYEIKSDNIHEKWTNLTD